MRYIQDHLSTSRKQFLKFKKKLNNVFEHHRSLEAVMGITKLKQENKKRSDAQLKFTHNLAIQARANSINYHASMHTKEIQNSYFICLDDNADKAGNVMDSDEILFSHTVARGTGGQNSDKLKMDSEAAKSKMMEKVHMKYISAAEVDQKLRKNLQDKG